MSRKKSALGIFSDLPIKIRKLRGSLTQSEFGKLIGVAQGTINKYEKAIICPGRDVLKKLAEYGGVTVEWLLRGDEPQVAEYSIKTQEHAPEIYDATPLPPLAEAALMEVIAAVEDYYDRHRLKRRPIQKARLCIRLYQHYAETREKPDDILIKGNLPLAD